MTTGSHRTITENLTYFIDNQGTYLDSPTININTIQNSYANNVTTVGGQLVLTNPPSLATLAEPLLPPQSNTLNLDIAVSEVGLLPSATYVWQNIWPKVVEYGVAFTNVANTPVNIGWAGKNTNFSTYTTTPLSPLGTDTAFQAVGSPNYLWTFPQGGHFIFFANVLTPSALSAGNSMTLSAQKSTNGGSSFATFSASRVSDATGDANIQSVSLVSYFYIPPASAANYSILWNFVSEQAFTNAGITIDFVRISAIG